MEGQDVTGRTAEAGPGQAQSAGKSGYEKIYDWVAGNLAGFDLEANAPHLGLRVHPGGGVVVGLFGRDYLVDQAGARALDGRPASFNHRSLVAHYAMSAGRGPASYEFVKLGVLSGVPAGTGQGAFERDAVSRPMALRFGHDLAGLEEAVRRIGGRVEPHVPGQGRKYTFEAFPLVPLRLVFEEPDEEFGPEFFVLFDGRGKEFMEFEALAFLGSLLIQELLGRADKDYVA
jgi:hypothetical protein